MQNEAQGLTFWDHIHELRSHLIAAAASFGVSLTIVLMFLGRLVTLLTAPMTGSGLIFLSPLGPFAFQMRVASLCALVLCLGPWAVILVHFVAPALSHCARRWTWLIVATSALLSVAAIVTSYLWVLPWSLRVLGAASVPGSQLLLTADAYLDFFVLETLFVALLLQLPLVLALLGLWGLIDPRVLARRASISTTTSTPC